MSRLHKLSVVRVLQSRRNLRRLSTAGASIEAKRPQGTGVPTQQVPAVTFLKPRSLRALLCSRPVNTRSLGTARRISSSRGGRDGFLLPQIVRAKNTAEPQQQRS